MEEHVTNGVTTDFDWYEIALIKHQLKKVSEKLDQVLEAARMREHSSHQYIIHLRKQNDELQVKINRLIDAQENKSQDSK